MDEIDLEELVPEEETEAEEIILATVAEVASGGVKLIFDGTDEASEKAFRCNTSIRFSAGDRVRIKKDSGSYIVEFIVGAPMANYPLPSGGTAGQILAKNSAADYDVKWTSAPSNPLPTGGSTGQMLVKSSNADYDVKWTSAPSNPLPTGGSTGQLLAKTNSTNYAVEWVDAPHGIPSGGSSGQVLTKNSNTNYDVSWSSPSAAKLVSGSYSVELSSAVLTPSAATIGLGSASKPFGNLYAQGTVYLGNSYAGSVHIGNASGSTLSFFGHTAAARQTVASTATVATLITALKNYGLIG